MPAAIQSISARVTETNHRSVPPNTAHAIIFLEAEWLSDTNGNAKDWSEESHFPMPGNKEKILAVVRKIPEGYVATYGQVAKLAGIPRNARQVGTVLRTLDDESDVPWFRVVNACGKISERDSLVFEGLQRHELENEGIVFDDRDRLDLTVYQWSPDNARGR